MMDVQNQRTTQNPLPGDFTSWKKAIAEYKGINPEGDDTYDYEGYYNENPAAAWSMMDKDSKAHFTDRYKTANHPSFSNESIYSGRVHPKYNPNGIEGGSWGGDEKKGWSYKLSRSQEDNNWDYGRTQEYFKRAESKPIDFQGSDGAHILPEVFVVGGKTSAGIRRVRNNK